MSTVESLYLQLEAANKKLDGVKTHTRQSLNEYFFNPNPIMLEEHMRWCMAYAKYKQERDTIQSQLKKLGVA